MLTRADMRYSSGANIFFVVTARTKAEAILDVSVKYVIIRHKQTLHSTSSLQQASKAQATSCVSQTASAGLSLIFHVYSYVCIARCRDLEVSAMHKLSALSAYSPLVLLQYCKRGWCSVLICSTPLPPLSRVESHKVATSFA